MIVWAKQKGFTIVELLIVIVVIAVLAAVTIVAYNGIQEKSRNTQVVSATASFVKAIRTYYVTYNDTVPMQSTAVQCFDGTSCWSGTDVPASLLLRTELQKVMPTLPVVPSGHPILVVQGSTTDSPNSGTYSGWYVLYQVINNGSCPVVSGVRYLNTSMSGNFRTCRAALEL